ncbi:MAG: PPK2 family polyphosphate kinase [Thermoguttaceae bacterium]
MNLYDKFRVKSSGAKVNLNKFSPDEREHGWHDHDKLDEKLAKNSKKLFDLQYKLYAENKQSLLIVLQALDAAGKDGTINHVISVMNPQGCRAQSFKVPTAIEASHDFLWREHCVAPHHGEVVIFNRSHYEDVLAGRIHGNVQGKTLKKHLEFINDFERLLHNNRTSIVKFFLHISKEEQLKRFGERLDDPAKHWKISDSDYKEREYWDEYMQAFDDVMTNCSTDHAPWFIIPANNKKFRNLAVSDILVHTLEEMAPEIPKATVDVDEIRKLYHQNLQEQNSAKNHKKSDEDDTDSGECCKKGCKKCKKDKK